MIFSLLLLLLLLLVRTVRALTGSIERERERRGESNGEKWQWREFVMKRGRWVELIYSVGNGLYFFESF